MANEEFLSVEGGGWVRWIRSGYGLPRGFRIRFAPDSGGRLVARELLVTDEDGLHAEMLREIPLARLERWVNRADVAAVVRELMDDEAGEPIEALLQRLGPRIAVPARKGRAPYPESFYRRVADVVSAGHSAAAIADASVVPTSTVNRWIKGAREQGFLAPSRRSEGD